MCYSDCTIVIVFSENENFVLWCSHCFFLPRRLPFERLFNLLPLATMEEEDPPILATTNDDNDDELSEGTLLEKELAKDTPACCDSCWACLLNDYLEDELNFGSDDDNNSDKEFDDQHRRIDRIDYTLSSFSKKKDRKKSKKKKKSKSKSKELPKTYPDDPSITDEPTDLSNVFVPGADNPTKPSKEDPEEVGDRYQTSQVSRYIHRPVPDDILSLEVKPSDPDGERLSDKHERRRRKKRSSSKRRSHHYDVQHDDMTSLKDTIPSDVGVLPTSSTATSRRPHDTEGDGFINLDDNKASYSRPRSRSRRRWDGEGDGHLEEEEEEATRSPKGKVLDYDEERSMRSRQRSRSRARHHGVDDELDLRDPSNTRERMDYVESKRNPSNHVLDLQLVPNRTGGDGTVDFPIEIPSSPSQAYHDGHNDDLAEELMQLRGDKYDTRRHSTSYSAWDDKRRPRRSTRRRSKERYQSDSRGIDLDVDAAVAKMLYADLPKRDKETRRLDRNSALERIRAIKNRIASSS